MEGGSYLGDCCTGHTHNLTEEVEKFSINSVIQPAAQLRHKVGASENPQVNRGRGRHTNIKL